MDSDCGLRNQVTSTADMVAEPRLRSQAARAQMPLGHFLAGLLRQVTLPFWAVSSSVDVRVQLYPLGERPTSCP